MEGYIIERREVYHRGVRGISQRGGSYITEVVGVYHKGSRSISQR
jgi:hypothetical protein